MTTRDFLDAIKARYRLPSDYALAHFMGISKGIVSSYRVGKSGIGDQTALKVAKLLELDPGYVLACLHAERAHRDDVREIWQKTAQTLKGTAAIAVICFQLSILCQIGIRWLQRWIRRSPARPALLSACLLLSACGDIEDLVDAAEALEARAARAEAVLDRIDVCLNSGAIVEPGADANTYVIHCL